MTLIGRGAAGWWAFGAMAVAVLLSTVLLRRRPLPALALLLAGSLAVPVVPGGLQKVLLVVVLVLPVLQVCFVAAPRPRRTSIAAVS